MTPSIKPDCVETIIPFDLNSPLPVASEKEPTTHAIQVGAGDEGNCFVTAISGTKEPVLAFEILMDNDCSETHEDGDITTAVLADKGKGVDPREYGGALYALNSMIVPTDTTSTGGSELIELVGVPNRDKGKNVDPEERAWNGMVKYESSPSQIDFHDHEEMSFQEQGIPFQPFEPTKMTDFDDGIPYDLSPYRVMAVSVPLAISTGQSGSIEFIGLHLDKRKHVDPEERENEMAECEPGPSRIGFHDYGAMSFQQEVILHQFFKRKRTTDLNDGLHYDPTLPRPSWHPKMSPYRVIGFLSPLAIGTVKAVLSYKGSNTTPTTLEWINGVVIYLL